MPEMNEDKLGEFIESQLRFLHGQGPEPDLSDLNEQERAEVLKMMDLVGVLSGSLPEEDPPSDDDHSPSSQAALASRHVRDIEVVDPVTASVAELQFRFAGAVDVEDPPPATGLPHNCHPVALCRSLAELVLVVVYDASPKPAAADAAAVLNENPEFSAIAITSPDAVEATIVCPGEATNRLVPSDGWQPPATLEWEPLGVALGRYLERSIPRWDAVDDLRSIEDLDDLGGDVVGAVSEAQSKLSRSRPKLAHKIAARDFVSSIDPSLFIGWVTDVRSRRLTGDDVAEAIRILSGADSQ